MSERESPGDPGRAGSPQAADLRLEAAFEAARGVASAEAPLPADLTARLLADAETARVAPQAPAPVSPRGAGPRSAEGGVLSRLAGVFGLTGAGRGPAAGWPAATGLAACALGGVWLGYAAPPAVEDLTGLILSEVVISDESILLATDDLMGALDGEGWLDE